MGEEYSSPFWVIQPGGRMPVIADTPASSSRRKAAPLRFVEKYFYTFMSLLVAVVVTYGFSRTVDRNLIHAEVPRPKALWFHGFLFYGWVLFFILQSALVRIRSVKLHKTLGWFGTAMGVAVVLSGFTITVVMARFQVHQLHERPGGFVSLSILDMLCFGTCFGLSIWWRKRPEYHRRLLLIANCAMAAPGFGRFPALIVPRGTGLFYAWVDVLILMGVTRDRLVNGRTHIVYKVALPILMVGQALAVYLALHKPALWIQFTMAIAR
jgi:hypothetical protein